MSLKKILILFKLISDLHNTFHKILLIDVNVEDLCGVDTILVLNYGIGHFHFYILVYKSYSSDN